MKKKARIQEFVTSITELMGKERNCELIVCREYLSDAHIWPVRDEKEENDKISSERRNERI